MVERLRQALAASPGADRYLIHAVSLPLAPVSAPTYAAISPAALAGEGQGGGYAISVVTAPITDTCKEVVDGLVRATVPRETLVEARGPWLFTREGLADALTRAVAREGEITDLLSLCEAAGVRVRILPMQ